jgi:hypothetical protein
MKEWLDKVEDGLLFDRQLCDIFSGLINEDVVCSILGRKNEYHFDDVKKLLKYAHRVDINKKYSITETLDLFKERTQLLLKRGSTLNDPNIPASYFNGLEHITTNHTERLRELVAQEDIYNLPNITGDDYCQQNLFT